MGLKERAESKIVELHHPASCWIFQVIPNTLNDLNLGEFG